jgi:hypothetical protein
LIGRLLSIAVLGAAIVLAALASHGLARRDGVMIPTSPSERIPSSGGTVESSNWSGYVVSSKRHRITSVSGSFVVPSASHAAGGFAATWAGIGGYRHSTLIQAGVAEQASRAVSGRYYYAWYELLPRAERPIPGHHVRPGERIDITIRRIGSSRWRMSIIDIGHWRWSRRVSYRSANASAEWILEAPTLKGSFTKLADVGVVHFGPGATFGLAGQRRTIGQGHPTRILLVGPHGGREATPSELAGHGRFDDCAYSRRCQTP